MRYKTHPLRSFIHSISIAPLQVHHYSEALQTQRESCAGVSSRSSEAPQATASDRLAQGPYVAARAGFEPMTFRTMSHHVPQQTIYTIL